MTPSKWWRRIAFAGAAFALVPAAPAMAQPVLDPGPVAPDQYFTGVVNGASGASRIFVVCDGPIDVVPLGHPVPGQTLASEQVVTGAPAATSVGFTGSAARSLEVRLGSGTVTLRFHHAPAAIPTTALVPCSGTGTVAFTPNPASPTSRAATVSVTFVGRS